MLNESLDHATKSDIEALVKQGTRENDPIDYKRDLPGDNPQERVKFLKSVSSFANFAGGRIIYGIEEERDPQGKKTGRPGAIVGLTGNLERLQTNIEQTMHKLKDIVGNGLAPALLNVGFRPVDEFDAGPLLVLSVPQSPARPHMVTLDKHNRYYIRDGNRVRLMEEREIREAHAHPEDPAKRLQDFREERLVKIIKGDTPAALFPGPKLVLHVVPTAAFTLGSELSDSALQAASNLTPMQPAHLERPRFNFDGYLIGAPSGTTATAYLQIFRTGVIESVMGPPSSEPHRKIIPGGALKRWVVNALQQYLLFLHDAGLDPPVFVLLSLLGVRGHTMGLRDMFGSVQQEPIDRDNLLVREAIIQDFGEDLPTVLRPVFNSVWQATGFPRSMNHDD